MLHSWWQKIKKPSAAVAVITLLTGVLVLLILAAYSLNWTDFFNKKLGDWVLFSGVWLILLLITVSSLTFTSRQSRTEREVASDNQHETAFQEYINKMSELLLRENLRNSAEDAEARKIARVRTLTVLHSLDPRRKRNVVQFLFDAGLIYKDKRILDLNGADLQEAALAVAELENVDLRGANLSHADLHGVILWAADLRGAELRGANMLYAKMSEADLSGANLNHAKMSEAKLISANLRNTLLYGATLRNTILRGANLHEANLYEADLRGAELAGADLSEGSLKGAKVALSQWKQAKSLKGTILPDGKPFS